VKNLRTVGSAFVALVLLGALVAVAGSAPPSFTASALTPDSTYTSDKSTSSSVAQTDPSLLGRTDSAPVSVMLKYDYDATASYPAGSPTSPPRARASPARR